MKQKERRWYDREDGELAIYNDPYKDKATACSITTDKDFPYYQNTFVLRKVWGDKAPTF